MDGYPTDFIWLIYWYFPGGRFLHLIRALTLKEISLVVDTGVCIQTAGSYNAKYKKNAVNAVKSWLVLSVFF